MIAGHQFTMAMGRAGSIVALESPFANLAAFDGAGMVYSPQPVQHEGPADFQR